MIDISYDEEDRCSQIPYLVLCLNIELTSYLMPVRRAPDVYGLMLRGSGLLQKPALLEPMFRPSQDPMRWCNDDVDGLSSAASSAKVWSQERHGEGDRP
jgi:hypothetical protein